MGDVAEKVPNIEKWITGEKIPTVKQLEDFSRKVHLPFGYLFLPEPPKEKLPIPFFRTGKGPFSKVSLNVYDTILLVQHRQEWLKSHLRDNGFSDLSFVGKYNADSAVSEVVSDMRQTLRLAENWASNFPNWTSAMDHLVEHIEDSGIITVFNGIFENNTHRKIEVDECRGFVLVDKLAPFMFINNADGKAAQMFTLAHELAHVWLGQSAGFDFRELQPSDEAIERFCDQIAAEFLVPGKHFQEVWRTYSNIPQAARYFKVSEIVIARRALDTGKINRQQFLKFYNQYISREIEIKENRSSGGDFYATTKKRLSITFASHINNAVKSGKLLYRDAYKLTSLKGDTFQTFFDKHF
ncbi:DNA-binding protein [Dyadobacter beijingensis]|uniref:DNA-binding protein n=1 Tax=Dyadobacter beijingensis TaxID=365489 RepID=A0ABQ2HBU1_9BACT|nr:DNA-binding protein [Dyadobacter beijingensis]